MKLNLKDIIEMPGTSVAFDCEPDKENLDFPGLVRYERGPQAIGTIRNSAGVLNVTGRIEATLLCECNRCGAEFLLDRETVIDAVAVTEDEPENVRAFLIEGDMLDMDDLLGTVFALDAESKLLCSEECKGLCHGCGADLNKGTCGCKKDVDPRMAVLEQLLDK